MEWSVAVPTAGVGVSASSEQDIDCLCLACVRSQVERSVVVLIHDIGADTFG